MSTESYVQNFMLRLIAINTTRDSEMSKKVRKNRVFWKRMEMYNSFYNYIFLHK